MKSFRWAAIAALSFGAVALPQRAALAQADDYPNHEVRMVIGFVAGSGADILVRYFADKFREVSGGKTFLVDNKPGAGGGIALKAIATAKPDGYTIGLSSGNSHGTAKYYYKEPPAGRDDYVLFGTVLKQAFTISVDAKSPFKTLADLTAHLKQKGAKGSYATSTPVGTMMGEFLKSKAGLETVQVNYRTIADALNGLMDGSIDFLAADPVFATANAAAGRIRILAVGSGTRIQAMPDIPTMKELGYDIDVPVWWGGMAPKGTPKPVLDKLTKWLNDVLKMPETVEFLKKQGSDAWISSAEEAEKQVDADVKRYVDYIRIAKIEPQ